MDGLLTFYPSHKYLIIEFNGLKYIEKQPKNDQEMIEFIKEVKPIVSQLDDFVELHKLREIIELNLKNVPIVKLNTDTILNLINMLNQLRPDKNILEKIKITNASPMFIIIFKACRGRLPINLKNIIEIENGIF
jgi:hypothetical protein